jgi:1-acyl-sn-glycerol-3-phosphate acyltransferase
MKVAQRLGLPIKPFTIDGSGRVHLRGEWKLRPGPVTLTLHPVIAADDVTESAPEALLHRLTEIVGRPLKPLPASDERLAGTVSGVSK